MNAELNNFIDALNLDYTAVFVPFSQSRNKAEKDPSINWKVTLKRGGAEITADYSQGFGHCPAYKKVFKFNSGKPEAWRKAQAIKYECEAGKVYTDVGPSGHACSNRNKRLPAPALADVLYSLIQDATVLDYPSFEEWAENLGFNPDSRRAEQIHRECLAQALKLRAMFNNSELATLSELFAEY